VLDALDPMQGATRNPLVRCLAGGQPQPRRRSMDVGRTVIGPKQTA
jgi:hypothetical protein